ncbi:DUF4169 family protein [Phenylobacterium sp. VNQ135]|uniref:DUF4169 family protein n=1 Tax=Phenylobacterium sp. VNQ135 TaxID=3400922 RepID=UPI003C0A0BF4
MAEPINLNKARKARDKAKAKAQAVENRVRFGRPKADSLTSKLEVERARRELEGKKRED